LHNHDRKLSVIFDEAFASAVI